MKYFFIFHVKRKCRDNKAVLEKEAQQSKHQISREEHSRITQAIRNRILPALQNTPQDLEELRRCLQAECIEAKKDKYSFKKKPKTLLFSLLRSQLVKACKRERAK